ncbi:hypothetical protein DL96DRAFT_1104443 [Flagelloscypha sp. PMI_526]|nr:hypothetical protein DL96DRAFT_1104443 [Flagelloscypha sp. PMI_526]
MAIPVVTFILGGWLIGVLADVFLQGVVVSQLAHYFSLYRKDKWQLKGFVLGLALLTTLKSVQSIGLLWNQSIVYALDLDRAAGLFSEQWYAQINVSTVALIAFYVQVFFLQRLYSVSGKIWPTAAIFTLFVFGLISGFICTVYSFQNKSVTLQKWLAVHLSTVLIGDLLLCGSTVYFLLQHSRKVLPQTVGMLNAIIRLTFQSAAPAALCALINLIVTQIGNGDLTPSASKFVAIACNEALPKLFAISALWTLNSRKRIQVHTSGTESTSDHTSAKRTARRTWWNGAFSDGNSANQCDSNSELMFRHFNRLTSLMNLTWSQGKGPQDFTSSSTTPFEDKEGVRFAE